MNRNDVIETIASKGAWSAPTVRRIEAGSAESQAAPATDGGGGAQGS